VTGNKALFDSNVIIYLSKRQIPVSFLDQFDALFISVITYMEILGYPCNGQVKTDTGLSSFPVQFFLIDHWGLIPQRRVQADTIVITDVVDYLGMSSLSGGEDKVR